ncbi:hypothetical protein [Curtobacterium sp. NPDC089185]|uniref:hypothetical protein n=1 Tax=Curtobacterium sp. NPDC089185 TaxID=3154968 RepID=UPI00343835D8
MASRAVLQNFPLSDLRPDWLNPRFLPGSADRFESDADVYRYIEAQFDAASVAESIDRHGFFPTEPLIAMRDESGDLIVLEGNRRLTALRGLADAGLRASFKDPRWRKFEASLMLDAQIPVLLALSREEVAPILGYRHVTGIAPWEPYQQARYVASLIDSPTSELSFGEVADLIGRSGSEVRSFYRNYSIYEQAVNDFELPEADRITDEFGVWNKAMTASGIREYLQAPTPRETEEGTYPLPATAAGRLANVVTWIFGPPANDEDSSHRRLIKDSRQISRLGKVLADENGAASLERGESLAAAEESTLDHSARFAEALGLAKHSLENAKLLATGELVARHRDSIHQLARLVAEVGGR